MGKKLAGASQRRRKNSIQGQEINVLCVAINQSVGCRLDHVWESNSHSADDTIAKSADSAHNEAVSDIWEVGRDDFWRSHRKFPFRTLCAHQWVQKWDLMVTSAFL